MDACQNSAMMDAMASNQGPNMHYLVFQLQFFGKLGVECPSYKGFCAGDLVALFQVFPLSCYHGLLPGICPR